MKIAKLLVLGALLFFGSSGAKAVDGNVWQKPAIPTEFASMTANEIYYFYNVGSQLLFTQGNAYGTQASVGERGLKIKIEDQGAGLYTLSDYGANNAGAIDWRWVFFEAPNIMYVDYNNQPDFFWEIKDMGNNVYRFMPSESNPNINDNTKFVGLNRSENPENTALTSDCEEGENVFVDWKLIPEATGDAYINALNVYEAAMKLKEQLDKAEEIGANVADQIAVYNNTSSTVEELNAATEATKKAIQTREEELAAENYDKATVENPVNVTKLFIKNPSFDGNDLSGWSGSGWGSYDPKENAERYSMNYDTYQDLTELHPGVYMFKANGFYRAGNVQPGYDNYKANNEQSKYAKIYATVNGQTFESSIASPYSAGLTAAMTTGNWASATDSETGEVYYIPHNMVASDEFFQAGYCNDNFVYVAVNEEGSMRVGVKKNMLIADDWSIFDDFKLLYYGNSDEAYRLILDGAIANVKEFDLEDKVYTESYLEAYNAAVEALKASASKDDILSNIAAVQEAQAALEENIDLWQQIVALISDAEECAGNDYLDPDYLDEVSDWASFDSEDMLKSHDMTNEELKEEIARVKNLIMEAFQHITPGADVTNAYLVNPNYDKNADGWTINKASGGNVRWAEQCYEAWNNSNFDIYQIVEKAPKGVYEISVQGFYRYGRGNYTAYLNHEQYTTKETCPVFIYLNSNSTPFTNVYGDPVQITDPEFYNDANGSSTGIESQTLDDGTTLYFPDQMASSHIAFEHGMYTQSAYGLVSQEGEQIRIGVKGDSSQAGDSWCIWDNFKLYYRGFQADVVKPVLEQAIIDGENALSNPIGKDVLESLQAGIDAAKAVVNGSDGEAMFEALSNLFDLQDAVNASKALFAKLEAANEDLASAIPGSIASPDIINEATNLNTTISNGLENRTYSDTDVEGLMNEISKAINRLGLPQDMASASDGNPIECTRVIVNPAYAEGNDKGWTGGASVNATATDAEKFNTNFNYYQLLQGLPEGTYKVSVQGFYRAGLADVDYASWVENSELNNNAYLYAAVGSDTVSVAMHRLATGAQPMEEVPDGWTWAINSEENKLAVPNSMSTAADAFMTLGQEGYLFSNNNVIVKVGEDGKLTIGLKKNVQIDSDWTIWTNWQLFYYGKNSSLEESDNPLSIFSIDSNGVVSAEVFSINGTRTAGLQRGVNIVRETLSDGSVRVRKITVK